MSYAYIYDSHKDEIAARAAKKIKPEIDALKKSFTTASAQQQAQLDRIEGQLAELLAMLKPDQLRKPSLVAKKAGDQQP